MIYYYLEKQQPDGNTFRYFRSELHTNMFGDIQIDRVWGRLGATENFRAEIYTKLSDANEAFFAIRAIRLQRGYQVVDESEFRQSIRAMIPRSKYGLLNIEIASFVPCRVHFKHFRKNALRHGVEYLGDLVQLHESDVVSMLSSRSNKRYDALTSSRSNDPRLIKYLGEIKKLLNSHGLQLNANIPGWERPSPFCLNAAGTGEVRRHSGSNILRLDDLFGA